ncbi:MAG: hypothetical protein WKG07_29340 [Hymenobacter sp.]
MLLILLIFSTDDRLLRSPAATSCGATKATGASSTCPLSLRLQFHSSLP